MSVGRGVATQKTETNSPKFEFAVTFGFFGLHPPPLCCRLHIQNDTGTETKVSVTTTTAVIRQRSTKTFGAILPVVAGIGAMSLLAVRLQ